MNKGIFKTHAQVSKAELDMAIATEKMINAFQMLIDKKAIVVRESTIELFPELWGSNFHKALPWMENAYMYCRLKLKYPKGIKLDFVDIETGTPIGTWTGKKAELI